MVLSKEPKAGLKKPGLKHSSDEALLDLVARGDNQADQAFALLYDRYFEKLCVLIKGKLCTKDAGLCEEIAHMTLIGLWRSAQSYGPSQGPVLRYIYGLLPHKIADYFRSLNGRVGRATPGINESARPPRTHGLSEEFQGAARQESAAPPAEALTRNDSFERVVVSRLLLKEEDWALLNDRYLRGMTCKQVALAHGIPYRLVVTRIANAKMVLRRLLPDARSFGNDKPTTSHKSDQPGPELAA